MKHILIIITLTIITITNINANDVDIKATVLSNETIHYFNKPITADSFKNMFLDGEIYGRIRSNNFYYRWKDSVVNDDSTLVKTIGASVVYETATYKNIDFLVAGYASRAFFNEDSATIVKGKDTFSRYQYAKDGDKYMFVLGQASLNYSGLDKTDIRLGRQIVETFYTASNDTKMVPNTFDGGVITTKILDNTKLKLAYLAEQKLRDHTTSHSVLMRDDRNTAEFSQWNGQDDSAMHRGLTYTALKAAGKPTDSPLLVLDFKNKGIENLEVNGAFYNVPELLSQGMLELNYELKFDGFSISPGFRYINQIDNGAGKVGGASYLNDTTGYKDKDSLDAQMIAARLVARSQNYKINLAYTNVLDEADLITPWRGFPTSGYTRSMGIYNWRANTQSYRIELVRNPNKTPIYKDPFIQVSVLYTEGDADKTLNNVIVNTDYFFYYFGIVQNIPNFEELQYRLRLGYADVLNQDSGKDTSYLDARFELNYLF